jgi:hypothetical protein
MTDSDVADSASVGFDANEIIYWVKAENLSNPVETTISAEGYNSVTFSVQFVPNYTVTITAPTN